MSLSNEELDKFNFEKGDTEGFVNYALSINGLCLQHSLFNTMKKLKFPSVV